MAWDTHRPVPWKQLLRLVGVFVVLINAFLYFTAKGTYNSKVLLTTLIAGSMYLLFTVVLAKFGLDPITQRNRRAETAAARRASKLAEGPSRGARPAKGGRKRTVVADGPPRPKPTSRTNAGNRQITKR
jgi:hypothetical protein